jgi:F420H(2)-dependent quinone reductase
MGHLWTRLHAAVYRATGGWALAQMGGQRVLLLETVGRRSGQRRVTPLQYLPRGDGFVVVASAGGAPRSPAWYLNLRSRPRARVWIGRQEVEVRAREARGEERIRLWTELTAANRWLQPAAQKAGRQLPVIVLERA